ncbi:Retrotransposon gag protein [Rhizoctonia solani]|uniref:Retrotransposon gag protein n=1 Tax=Rhizoctonia solani TaxID=456999 RepID=A0A8H8P404_9AGAM|nr:Retrotransposon gag protein [Rhizoctonia solani]QRW24725.1 Retrotransposon gag protein [Rhizoctonia solani]
MTDPSGANAGGAGSLHWIPPLRGANNYNVWRIQMEDVLTDLDLYGHADGSKLKPNPKVEVAITGRKDNEGNRLPDLEVNSNNPLYASWIKADRKALSNIRLRVDGSVLTHIQGCTTAADAWSTLEATFQVKGTVGLIDLRRQFFSHWMTNGTPFPPRRFTIPSTRSGVPHPYSCPSSRSSQRSVATHSQSPSCGPSPPPQHVPGMEPEPTTAALLEAILNLTNQVGSLQAQISSQGQQLAELKAICKETNNLVGDKDQGGTQAKPGPSTGPVTPPTHTGGETHTPGTVRPGLKAPFRPSRGTGFDSEEEEEPRRPKKEPCSTPRSLSSLTPFDTGSSVKRSKMDLPDPYKGEVRGQKATQWLDRMMLWVALHRDQFDEEEQMVVWILYHMTDKAANWALPIIGTIIKGKGNPPTTITALTAKFKEAFADPNAKRAAARKIAALTQTTTTAEYVTKFRNLMAELDWNKEAYIAQFMRGLHWKVKELLSTKDSIPDNLEAIFAAAIKIDNIRRKNEENCPKKAPAKSPATVATSTTTTRVRLSKDPNYVTPEERDCCHASGLCVKCGQKGHGIKQCPNGWKATVKEVAKVAEEGGSGKD